MSDPDQKIKEINSELERFDHISAELNQTLIETEKDVKDIEGNIDAAEEKEKQESQQLIEGVSKELKKIFE